MKTRSCLLILSLSFSLSVGFLMASCSDDSDDRPAGPSRPTMNKQDSLAIVAYYHSMKCAEWTGGFHWDLKDYTTWAGVYCLLDEAKNEYRVKRIETPFITEYMPDGYSIPPELGNLTALEELVIWGDERATGGIPPEIFNCPLRSLLISGGNSPHGGFTGTLPKEIEKVANTLEELHISNTSIGGEIPEEVGCLTNLKMPANLLGNNFAGKVPLFLRNLPFGVILVYNYFSEMDWLYYTEDIGTIPDLMHNHLCGEIPDEVLQSERWKHLRSKVCAQENGYGYNEKYFN